MRPRLWLFWRPMKETLEMGKSTLELEIEKAASEFAMIVIDAIKSATLLRRLNKLSSLDHPDDAELTARIKSYELGTSDRKSA